MKCPLRTSLYLGFTLYLLEVIDKEEILQLSLNFRHEDEVL